MKDYILTKENEEEQNKEKNKDKYFNGDNNEIETKVVDNHIYYYSSVNKKSALELNMKLREVENKLLKKYNDHNNHQEYIYLHINSFGGSVFSAFSVIDTIKNMKVPVVSIIEGAAASAATLISVMCDYRIIYKTSYMLIHQLSSGSWGKMNELEEEMENLKELMNSIKTIYKEKTNIPRGEISEILKHDLWWNADICLAKGLVDEIKTTDKKYKFSKGLITF
jgi:ATP-dependent protease ClpP protease subunit|tara:strand:+ start:192 stop:860 length:669 start_codon:yes stop_codon:yes gene_type:complete